MLCRVGTGLDTSLRHVLRLCNTQPLLIPLLETISVPRYVEVVNQAQIKHAPSMGRRVTERPTIAAVI